MISLPFIDVHTHHPPINKDTVRVINLYPGDVIPAFNGKNFYSMGLHPWKIKSEKENNSSLRMLKEAMEFDHVIFAGECGLDKNTATDFEEQKRVFIAQALMAEEFQKPLIIHCVRAYNEIIEMNKSNQPSVPWIIHGYTGSPELTNQLLDQGFMFSFGKILFNEKAKAINSFKELPLQRVFIETDEFHGTVREIYEKAAELKNISLTELKKVVWSNFNQLENVSFEI